MCLLPQLLLETRLVSCRNEYFYCQVSSSLGQRIWPESESVAFTYHTATLSLTDSTTLHIWSSVKTFRLFFVSGLELHCIYILFFKLHWIHAAHECEILVSFFFFNKMITFYSQTPPKKRNCHPLNNQLTTRNTSCRKWKETDWKKQQEMDVKLIS